MHTRLSYLFLAAALDTIDAAFDDCAAYDYIWLYCAGGEL